MAGGLLVGNLASAIHDDEMSKIAIQTVNGKGQIELTVT